MIFKRFLRLKPKWQHGDPEVRRLSLPSIPDEDQATLIHLACHDSDAAVRRQACRRLNRLDVLRERAAKDPDAGVREFAAALFRNLMCAQAPQGPALEVRLEELQQVDDQRLFEQIATTANHPALRRTAIERLQRGEVLLECALNDSAAANRLEAAQRIQSRALLEQLAQRIGKKDKNVYRAVHQRLREIAEREATPARLRAACAELCAKVERLGRLQSWSQDRTLLEHIERQWSGLAGVAEPDLAERFQAARQRFLDAFEAYRRENAAHLAAEVARSQGIEERAVLIETLRAAAAGGDLAALLAARDQVESAWQLLAPLPEDDERRSRKELAEAQVLVSSRLTALAAARQRAERLDSLLGQAQALLAANTPLEQQALKALHNEISALGDTGDTPELSRHLGEVLAQLQERFEQQQHAEQRLKQLPLRLDELEAHIEAGELRKAEPLAQSTQATLALLAQCGVDRWRYTDLERRLHGLIPRLRVLQHWRKWGTDQHRATLCDTLDELLGGDQDPAHLTRILHEAQAEWKRLDQSGSRVNRQLWERFHSLVEQIYQRCRPYLEHQSALREQHRAERAALCSELEQFLDQVDWTRMDWKKAVRAERQMRAAWASAGPLEGRQRRELEQRFHQSIERLHQHLNAERERNRELKRGLIAQVEALAAVEDLHHAIAETKRLQGQWHTTVPGRPGEENRLWQRFRQACDAVFARRHADEEARVRGVEKNLHLRRAICDELSHLSSLNLSASELEHAFGELRERWETLAHLEVSPKALPALERAWRDAQVAARAAIKRAHEEHERLELDLLRQRSHLCAELEAQATARGSITAEAMERIQATWAALPPLGEPRLADAIAARFAQAAAVAGEVAVRDYAENLKKREEICLRLEILAGIDSPEGIAAERLAFQVSRLREHMRDGSQDPLEGAEALEVAWYLTGPVTPERAAELEVRFERARRALRGAHPGDPLVSARRGTPRASSPNHE